MDSGITQLVNSIFDEVPKHPCERFLNCNAPICPIDRDWKLRVHLKDDPVCYYLRLVAKDPEADKNEGRTDPGYQAAMLVWAARDTLAAPLQKQLLRASNSPPKTQPKKPVDPAKAEAAMLKLQKVFREDMPLSRFI